MFERYTEKARRVIFFARYEAASSARRTSRLSTCCSACCARTRRSPIDSCAHARSNPSASRSKATPPSARRSPPRSISVSNECKRVLGYAQEPSASPQHIGTEHLLLGLLREENALPPRSSPNAAAPARHPRELQRTTQEKAPIQQTGKPQALSASPRLHLRDVRLLPTHAARSARRCATPRSNEYIRSSAAHQEQFQSSSASAASARRHRRGLAQKIATATFLLPRRQAASSPRPFPHRRRPRSWPV